MPKNKSSIRLQQHNWLLCPSQIFTADANQNNHKPSPHRIGRPLKGTFGRISATYLRITFCAGCWAIFGIYGIGGRGGFRREKVMKEPWTSEGAGNVGNASILFLEVIQGNEIVDTSLAIAERCSDVWVGRLLRKATQGSTRNSWGYPLCISQEPAFNNPLFLSRIEWGSRWGCFLTGNKTGLCQLNRALWSS